MQAPFTSEYVQFFDIFSNSMLLEIQIKCVVAKCHARRDQWLISPTFYY
jgi:hypothetical protein